MNKRIIIFLILLFITLSVVLYYFLFISPFAKLQAQYNESSIATMQPNCLENATMPCEFKNCQGMRTCENGEWSFCTIKIICKPNSTTECYKNGCVSGYKICNECGTEYGPCTT